MSLGTTIEAVSDVCAFYELKVVFFYLKAIDGSALERKSKFEKLYMYC